MKLQSSPMRRGTAVTKGALPVAWDGHPVRWGEWSMSRIFVCARSRRRSVDLACGRCGADTGLALAIRGVLQHPACLPLVLTRCTECAADTVVDWRNAVWDLDEADYEPEGSFAPALPATQPALFDTPAAAVPRCYLCGREGSAGLAEAGDGQWRCEADDLCVRRAVRHR